jgi:predicted ATP-dependent serine protease
MEKIITHEYRDPYRDHKCIVCGGKNPKNTGKCRLQYHGWQAISENAERARKNYLRRMR